MNYERLLTRVWDKQEKKMIYPGDKIGTGKDVLVAVTNDRLIITGDDYSRFLGFWKFGDRFVPMLCLGNTDKNKKLIYSADIVATPNNKYLVYREEKSAAFWFKRLDNECELLIDDFSCEIEIIGNRWEQPELLEAKA